MSSDNTDRLMRDLERILDEEWVQEDDSVGFVPPAPPARRAVAQSTLQTARNVAAANMAMEACQQMLTGNGANQPAGVINAGSKPEKKQVPSNDLTKRPKRKITLE